MLNGCFISSPGWWLVENDSKGLAWFPAPYLQLLDGEDEEDTVFQHAGMCHFQSNYNMQK